ncbi:MAG: hypothetical protein A2201_04625 [Alicyclobacillus sp. RIFOXYA1_FULL_53_8]|nr:MAG: hypothetical protein A2201_04625 [Alicyclobacillus sp. RIFOXYA1_FULL_53_8]
MTELKLNSPYGNAFSLAVSRGFSALGGQISITILPVVVFLISHSMTLAGMVLGGRLLISVAFTPISGLFVDRWNPKPLMLKHCCLPVRYLPFVPPS